MEGRRGAIGLAVACLLGLGFAGPASAQSPQPTIEVAPGVYLASFSEFGSEPPGPDRVWRAERGEAGPIASPAIVGGRKTEISRWPWQVEIASRLFGFKNPRKRHHCGGSLLTPTIVVTAAHCLTLGRGEFEFKPDLFFARLGLTKLTGDQGTSHELADYYWFVDKEGKPLWNADTAAWDVAFLELATPSDQKTIRIAGSGEGALWAPGQRAYVTGWGTTKAGVDDEQREIGSNFLRVGKTLMLSDSRCDSVYGPIFLPAVAVCAGLRAGRVDACGGDSGGPLVVPIAGPRRYRLVGDVSYGSGCGLPGVPGVYGRLASDPIRGALANGVRHVSGARVVGTGAEVPNGFSFGRVVTGGHPGSGKLTVRIPGPGQLRLAARGQLRKKVLHPKRAGGARLRLSPAGKTRRRLLATGRASVAVEVTYTPLNGASRTQSRWVRLHLG